MTDRIEFTRATRRDALKRAGSPPLCEATGSRYGYEDGHRCNTPLAHGVEFDHYIPFELSRDSSLENARAICPRCHKFATPNDIRTIRKSDRVRDKNNGTFKPSPRGFRRPVGSKYDWRKGGYVHPDTEARHAVEGEEK